MPNVILRASDFTLSTNAGKTGSDALIAYFSVPRGMRLRIDDKQPFFLRLAADTSYTITSGDVSAGNATITVPAFPKLPSPQWQNKRGTAYRAWLIAGATTEEYDYTPVEGGTSTTNTRLNYFPTNNIVVQFADTTATEAAGNTIRVFTTLGDGRVWIIRRRRGDLAVTVADRIFGPVELMDLETQDPLDMRSALYLPPMVIDEQERIEIYLNSNSTIAFSTISNSIDINKVGDIADWAIPVIVEYIR